MIIVFLSTLWYQSFHNNNKNKKTKGSVTRISMEGRKEKEVSAAISALSSNSSCSLSTITQSYGDNATLQITQHKLNGKNFLQRS